MKMGMMHKVFIVLIAVIGVASAETGGYLFLQEDLGAKSFGMGSAFTSVCDDLNSVSINPAGLSYFCAPEISAVYKKDIMDFYSSSVYCAVPLGKLGVAGFGLLLNDLGSLEINYLDGTSETVSAMRNWVGSASYGLNVLDVLSLGVNAKVIRSTFIGRYTAYAYAADLGLLFRTTNSKFSMGLSAQNIGTNITYLTEGESLPFIIRTGVSYRARETQDDSWLLAVDASYLDGKLRYNAGIECELLRMIALRAGYKIGYDPDSLTLGLGFKLAGIKIDYGYSVLGNLDSMQTVSMSYGFGPVSDFDKAKAYYDKGMKEKALSLFKNVKIRDSNYSEAQQYISNIETERPRIIKFAR